MNNLLPLAVALPLFGAALAVVFQDRRIQRAISFVTLSGSLTLAVLVLAEVVRTDRPVVARLGGWPADIAITFVADHLSALMLIVSVFVTSIVLVFAIGQRAVDEKSPAYHPVYLLLVGGISQTFIAGDLFNLFVGFELLLMASYVLLTLEGTVPQIRAGVSYVVMNIVESIVLLLAIGLVFAATGTVSMAELPERLAALPDGVGTGLNLLLLVAFGIKAAVFPLYFWLPDSYPAATSSVTAVFAGLLTKVGAYAILRTETLLFPGNQQALLMVIAGITMVVGVIGAISLSNMKRLLSFHIVSQIGYIVMGIGLGSEAALAATVFFLLHQIPVKTSLFLVEGIIERETGASSFDAVSGLARRSGVLSVLFLLPALSLAGLPPFSGFLGKYALLREGLALGEWVLVGVAGAVSILTLVSMVKIWTALFWGDTYPAVPQGRIGILRHHRLMSSATIVLVASTLAIVVFAGPVYEVCLDAARLLADPSAYIKAVRGS